MANAYTFTNVGPHSDITITLAQYHRFRDDQRNTGIISALVGGFALTNSWNIDINSDVVFDKCKEKCETNTNCGADLCAYTCAIFAVHGCAFAALLSAFLYRSITRVSEPKGGVAWVKGHRFLVQLPWYLFMFGAVAYIISVFSVAWTTLQDHPALKWSTLAVGLTGAVVVGIAMIHVLCDFHSNNIPVDPF